MKTRNSVKWMLVGALLSWGLTACSSGGEEEQGEEVNATEEGAEGNENAAAEGENAEGGENAAAEGENANGNIAAGAEGNEGGDIAAEGNFTNSEIPPELLNSETATANAGAEGTNTNAMAGAEGTNIPTDAANAAPSNIAGAEGTNAAAAPAAAPVAASGDMRVYYVKDDGSSIKNAPNGQSVGPVAKGDPLLVKIEGDWASVANRGYIEVAALSQTPVGRSLAPKAWK